MSVNLKIVAPEVFLSVMAMVILLLGTFLSDQRKRWLAYLTLFAFIITARLLAPFRLDQCLLA